MAKEFWQRCPECKRAQYWAQPTTIPQQCGNPECQHEPGLSWEGLMASKYELPSMAPPPPPLRATRRLPPSVEPMAIEEASPVATLERPYPHPGRPRRK